MLKVVFFGSSTIEGHGASTPSKRATTLVAAALGWRECNLGIGGTMVTGRDSDGFLTSQDSGVARVPDVIELKPDLVIVLYGSNDFGNSIPIGVQDEFEPGTFWSEYDTMIRGLVDAIPPEHVILSTLQYRSDAEQANTAGAVLDDYNAVIRGTALKYKLALLETNEDSSISKTNFEAISADEIHLNDEGYERLAGYIIESLSKIGGAFEAGGSE